MAWDLGLRIELGPIAGRRWPQGPRCRLRAHPSRKATVAPPAGSGIPYAWDAPAGRPIAMAIGQWPCRRDAT
eukprot:9470223-Pyramimonas_sp.AAC.1